MNYIVKIFCVFVACLNTNIFAQQPGLPPFSHVKSKPVISPYIVFGNIDLPVYQMQFFPFVEYQKNDQVFKHKNSAAKYQSNPLNYPNECIRPTGHNVGAYSNGYTIRTTGHPSRFMNLSHYYGGY